MLLSDLLVGRGTAPSFPATLLVPSNGCDCPLAVGVDACGVDPPEAIFGAGGSESERGVEPPEAPLPCVVSGSLYQPHPLLLVGVG
eukprot:1765361-Rhodomonas_salina.1